MRKVLLPHTTWVTRTWHPLVRCELRHVAKNGAAQWLMTGEGLLVLQHTPTHALCAVFSHIDAAEMASHLEVNT